MKIMKYKLLLILSNYLILHTYAAKPFNGSDFRKNFSSSSGDSFGKPSTIYSISGGKSSLSNQIGKTYTPNIQDDSKTISKQQAYNPWPNGLSFPTTKTLDSTLRQPAYNPFYNESSVPITKNFGSNITQPAYNPNFVRTLTPTTNVIPYRKSYLESKRFYQKPNSDILNETSNSDLLLSSTEDDFNNKIVPDFQFLNKNNHKYQEVTPRNPITFNKSRIIPIFATAALIPAVLKSAKQLNKPASLTNTTEHQNTSLTTSLKQVNGIENFPAVDFINNSNNFVNQTNSTDLKIQNNCTYTKEKTKNARSSAKVLQNSSMGLKGYNVPAIHRYNMYKSQQELNHILQTKKPFYMQTKFIIIGVITSFVILIITIGALVCSKIKK